jgi:hypothetical protein
MTCDDFSTMTGRTKFSTHYAWSRFNLPPEISRRELRFPDDAGIVESGG